MCFAVNQPSGVMLHVPTLVVELVMALLMLVMLLFL
jgi:hypothetical protein